MGIQSLILSNWKSYAGDHTIPLSTFTSIVGPNGAGKSNIMDAISFVLGVKTAKLRGKKMVDHIHRKESERDKPVKRTAYVEIVYQKERSDEIIRFRRSVSASGTAQYHLDGKVVKWPVYNRQLKDIGVLVRARNFLVFQGDVESIVLKSPQELTEMLEQVSGSAQYIQEYKDLMDAMNAAESNMQDQFERKRNIGREKRQLKDQKAEAEQYARLKDEQATTKTDFILWQLFHAERDISKCSEQFEDEKEQLEDMSKEHEDLLGEVKAHTTELSKLLKDKNERRKILTGRQKKFEAKTDVHDKLKEQIKALNKNVKKGEAAKEKAQKKLDDQNAKISDLGDQHKEIQGKMEEFDSQIEEKASQDLKMTPSQKKEYYKAKGESGVKTAPERQKLDKLKVSHEKSQSLAMAHRQEISALEQRRVAVTESAATVRTQRRAESERAELAVRQLAELKEKRTRSEEDRKANDRRRSTVQDQLDLVQQKLQDLSSYRRDNKKSARMDEALEALKRLYPGVRGRVTELFDMPNRRYAMAVAAALGHNRKSVVVDDERTAVEAIKYLKEQRVGKATFIPISTIKAKPIKENLRRLGNGTKLAIDVINFDESLKRAMMYVFGNTLVCESLDIARELCYRRKDLGTLKAVTVKGTVIDKNGYMTGGMGGLEKVAKSLSENDSQERRELQQIPKLEEKRRKCQDELQSLDQLGSQSVHDELYEITTLEKSVEFSTVEIKAMGNRLDDLLGSLEDIERDIAVKVPEEKKASTEAESFEQKMKSIEVNIEKTEKAIFAKFCRAVGCANIAEFEAKLSGFTERHSERKMELANTESRLKQQLDYEKSRNLVGPLKKIESRLRSDVKKRDELKREEDKLIKDIDGLSEKIRGVVVDSDEISSQIDLQKKEMQKQNQKAKEVQKSIAKIRKTIASQEARVEQARVEKEELIKAAGFDQIDLPIFPGEISDDENDSEARAGAKRKKGAKKGRSRKRRRRGDDSSDGDSDEKSSDVEMEEEEEKSAPAEFNMNSKFDYSRVEDREAKTGAAYNKQKRQFEVDLERLTSSLEKMNPNMKAVDQFKEIKKRASASSETYMVAKRAYDHAHEDFEKVEKKRSEVLREAFDHVQEEIKSIYKALTISVNAPIGGMAYLYLENEDIPFDGGVKFDAQPPNKRFGDMDQLSGGEKTVAALALVFAIHSFRPSPFFILDEIDAPLDSGNVNRVANYIRSRAHLDKLQMIVISLKDKFYYMADHLIGIYRDADQESSGTLSLDLTKYDSDAVNGEA
eukprot:104058_1